MRIITNLVNKIGWDKLGHLQFSILGSLLLIKWTGIEWLGALIMLGIGVGKELLDDKIEIKDIIADFIGVIIGVVLNLTI